MLEPLNKNILFAFYDDISGGIFRDKSEGGIQLILQDQGGSKPRWGKILATGPNVTKELKKGDDILIEPLMWTNAFEHEGVKIWVTDETRVLLVRIP